MDKITINIIRILNIPVKSNCFLVFHNNNKSCLVIDPGSEKDDAIINSIKDKKVDYIFLTHEHFDHIWCADQIRKKYNSKLYCSIDASKGIIDKKKNMSIFYDQIGFELSPCDVILNDEQIINWKGIDIQIIYTPGHTNGSICIKINDNLFTGDTIIKGVPTVTKLPGGSKEKLKNTMNKLKTLGINNFNLYCGHGESDIKTR